MDYCTGRGALGPAGPDFGAACDQIDRADLMLADLHQRARHGLAQQAYRTAVAPTNSRTARNSPNPFRSLALLPVVGE